jgi:hypothetical protein
MAREPLHLRDHPGIREHIEQLAEQMPARDACCKILAIRAGKRGWSRRKS